MMAGVSVWSYRLQWRGVNCINGMLKFELEDPQRSCGILRQPVPNPNHQNTGQNTPVNVHTYCSNQSTNRSSLTCPRCQVEHCTLLVALTLTVHDSLSSS